MIFATPWRADKTTEIYHIFFFSLPIHRKSAFIKNSNQQKIYIIEYFNTQRERAFRFGKNNIIEHNIFDIN